MKRGFDTSGPVKLTEAPRVVVDATTGEVEADSEEDIEKKRVLHNKRQNMNERWAGKGLSDEHIIKIQNAELRAAEKKRQGHEYMMKGGWVSKTAGGKDIDVAKHNERCKQFGAR